MALSAIRNFPGWLRISSASSYVLGHVEGALQIVAQQIGGLLSKDNDGALDVENTANDGVGFKVYSNHASGADTALAAVWADNPNFDQEVFRVINDGTNVAMRIESRNAGASSAGGLWIETDGTGGGNYDLKMSAPGVDVEFIDTDDVSPIGDYELAVQNDEFQFNGRNAANTSFEAVFKYHREDKAGSKAGLLEFPIAASFQSTVGSAGAASALPATPTKYIKIVDATGTTVVIPCYDVS